MRSLSRINELGQSIKQIFFQKNLNVFSTNFQIDQIFHHLTKQTLYHQSNNTYIVLHIYIYMHIDSISGANRYHYLSDQSQGGSRR